MAWFFIMLLFILSCFLLSWLSSHLIHSLIQIAKYLRWREFIIAFFVMAFAASLPNLFVDLNAALQHKPQISVGDLVGGNLVDLTLVLAVAVFFSRKGLVTKSDMVQKSALFTTLIAILPLLLMLDGTLGRTDGLVLIVAFMIYTWWIFSEKERFSKRYHTHSDAREPIKSFTFFLWCLVKVVVLLALLLASSEFIIWSAAYFSSALGISLSLVGILIVGLGNAFPETYFSIVSARKEENWLVLGDLMGSVIVCATLVLGIIAILAPFHINDLYLFSNAMIF